MANENSRRAGSVGRHPAVAEDAWSLESEQLARRVPRFAAYVEGPDGGGSELTGAQRDFLDKFSSGLEEEISEEEDESDADGGRDANLP